MSKVLSKFLNIAFVAVIRGFVISLILLSSITAYAKDDSFLAEEVVYEMAVEIGAMYEICPELLVSIAYQESRYKVDAVNGHNVGIMQNHDVYNKERMERLEVTDLYDPYSSMLVAADYLSELKAKYQDIGAVLMVYHGERGVQKYLDGKKGLSKYANEILERSEEMERKNKK